MMPLWYYETKNSFGNWAVHTTDDFSMIPKGAGRIYELPPSVYGRDLGEISAWVHKQVASVPTSGEKQEEPDLRIADTTMAPLVPVPESEPTYVGSDSRLPAFDLNTSAEDRGLFMLAALKMLPPSREASLAISRLQEAIFWAREAATPSGMGWSGPR
jgi:hypothetical protein